MVELNEVVHPGSYDEVAVLKACECVRDAWIEENVRPHFETMDACPASGQSFMEGAAKFEDGEVSDDDPYSPVIHVVGALCIDKDCEECPTYRLMLSPSRINCGIGSDSTAGVGWFVVPVTVVYMDGPSSDDNEVAVWERLRPAWEAQYADQVPHALSEDSRTQVAICCDDCGIVLDHLDPGFDNDDVDAVFDRHECVPPSRFVSNHKGL